MASLGVTEMTTSMSDIKRARLAAAIVHRDALLAKAAERKAAAAAMRGSARAERNFDMMNFRFERLWDAGVSVQLAAAEMVGGTVNVFDYEGKEAGQQMRLDGPNRFGSHQRIFVRLNDDRLASATCTVYQPSAPDLLAYGAFGVASAAADRLSLKAPRLRDEDGQAKFWWLRD
jgi:hypothetical protein